MYNFIYPISGAAAIVQQRVQRHTRNRYTRTKPYELCSCKPVCRGEFLFCTKHRTALTLARHLPTPALALVLALVLGRTPPFGVALLGLVRSCSPAQNHHLVFAHPPSSQNPATQEQDWRDWRHRLRPRVAQDRTLLPHPQIIRSAQRQIAA